MKDVAFVSVAFGQEYLAQQKRLEQSILAIYPEANILFFHGRLPGTSKSFYDSLYGFKPHAIQEARKRWKKVLWLDPAMILVDKIDDLLNHPMIGVRDDSVLHNVISNKTLNFYRLTRELIREAEWHLVGGSLYYFDFTTPIANNIFDMWHEAELNNLFGSQYEAASEQLQGHRYDETLIAIAMYTHGVKPQTHAEVRYCIEKNPMFIKKHFK